MNAFLQLPDIINEELAFAGDDEVVRKYPSGSMARTEEVITLPLPRKWAVVQCVLKVLFRNV